MNEEEVYKKLMELRHLTIRFGAIHDLQKFQIEMLPQVAFPGILSSEARIHIDDKIVEYNISVSKAVPERYKNKATRYISDTLTKLLWPDTITKFKFQEVRLVRQKRARNSRRAGPTGAGRAKGSPKV